MVKARKCRVSVSQFFIEPTRDAAYANDVIAKKLRLGDADFMNIKDKAGTPRDVLPCTLSQARELWRSRDTLHISFELWGRNRNYGPIVYKTFLLRK